MNSTAHVDEVVHGNVLEVDLHGRLSRADYERLIPETEELILKHGRIRVLVTMHNFDGWDVNAVWEDIKWNARHFSQIERLAIVGKATWHRLMTGFARPFTSTQVRYFPPEQLSEARAWISEHGVS